MIGDEKKPRLYVALYRLGGALGGTSQLGRGRYHWALIIGPKKEKSKREGTRWLMRQVAPSRWRIDRNYVTMAPHDGILVRITIGKIKNVDRTVQIIESFGNVANNQQATLQTWIQAVITALAADANACLYVQSWTDIEIECEQYVTRKIDDGRFLSGPDPPWDVNKIPTRSMIEKHEYHLEDNRISKDMID